MAYAAVSSLKNTIERLRHSYHVSIVFRSLKIIKSAYNQLCSLEVVLLELDKVSTRFNRERVNSLDERIREVVYQFEDVIDTHLSNQFLSQPEIRPLSFSIELRKLKQDVHSFTKMVRNLKRAYRKALCKPMPEEEEDDDHAAAPSSRIDFGGNNKSKMVGLSDEFHKFKDKLTIPRISELRTSRIVPLVGMAGIGKTTLAKEIYDDAFISNCFDFRAWVTVGTKYQMKYIVECILAQVDPKADKRMLRKGDLRIVGEYLRQRLKGRTYLIVLDDVWESQVFRDLVNLLPNDGKGSRILVTTRLHRVASFGDIYGYQEMRFLNKEESWDLLRDKVFCEELCPHHLEKFGKKIAENCEGHPLTIVTVAKLLSKAEKTIEYWSDVAENKTSLFMDAYYQMWNALFPSYEYLPQYAKACFLYMGVFPKKHEVCRSELIKLWGAEGFLKPDEDLSIKCLGELVSNSVVIVVKQSTTWSPSSTERTKSCSLHSPFRHLCIREAGKNKFYHVLKSRKDGLTEGIKGHHRLCVHNNVLFGIKDVYNSMMSISSTRSLLCTGPYHQYSIPLCFGLKLLKVLNALSICLYEFPMEVLKLVQLGYLAITCNENPPTSISKLWNLECLIVHRHMHIKSSRAPSYLPMEIWDMKELKHLIMGSDMPDPPCGGVLLPKLSTRLDVSAYSCTKGVLEGIPNLKKIRIRIELALDVDEPVTCLDHISCLKELQSLNCVIVNPKLGSPPLPLPSLPSGLKKLTLSGFGYPLEDMTKIASLPKLEALKLRCNAFRGPKWEPLPWGFKKLKFLQLEDIDLVQWGVGIHSFPMLNSLSIKHCYKLEVHQCWRFGVFFEKIEPVGCSPSFVTWIEQLAEAE